MKFFITLSKRNLAVILAALIIIFLILGQLFTAKSTKNSGATNAIRIEYIKSLGLEPDESQVNSKSITIPENFSKVYKDYNALQKEAGFDLSHYKGDKATLYTYYLYGGEKEVHLIVLDNEIIGGDIADININGKILPLKRNR